MKYYIYISDAKVDMLFPQVPHDIKKKVALEFKMDLKLLSASRKTETETEDNRIARLETVVDFIRQYGDVGSVDDPGEYVADCLTMRWGSYGDSLEDSPVVYFGGTTEKTIVGLGGSMKHLLGSAVESHPHSYSARPFLMKYLVKDLQIRLPDEDEQLLQARCECEPQFDPIWAVDLATTQMKGPEQRVEFLAKRLACGPAIRSITKASTRDRNVLLATPIYVAMGE